MLTYPETLFIIRKKLCSQSLLRSPAANAVKNEMGRGMHHE